MNQWRDALDFPPVDELVLVHLPDEREFPIWLGYWDGIEWHSDAGTVFSSAPRHWQPLPEPPGVTQ